MITTPVAPATATRARPIAGRGSRRLSGVLLLAFAAGLSGCSSATFGVVAAGDPVAVEADSALAALETIPVKGRAANTGYDRDQFGPAWRDIDNNGCDQRNDVLRRDLTDETIRAGTRGCVVLTGQLTDPYTGERIAFTKADAGKVQIDHVVALQNAWVTGAFGWTEQKRSELANDPLNLLAVDGPTNASKGAGDAATWLPPRREYRCAYVARQVAVKAKYQAWVTPAEHAAITKVLAGCPDEKLPTAGKIELGSQTSTSVGDPVAPGAFCADQGASGSTAAGTAMVCSAEGDERARWRSAEG